MVRSEIGHHLWVWHRVTSHSCQLSLLSPMRWEMSTSQGAVAVFCCWEGNHTSHVSQTGISTYRLNCLGREMSTPPMLLEGVQHPLPLYNIHYTTYMPVNSHFLGETGIGSCSINLPRVIGTKFFTGWKPCLLTMRRIIAGPTLLPSCWPSDASTTLVT